MEIIKIKSLKINCNGDVKCFTSPPFHQWPGTVIFDRVGHICLWPTSQVEVLSVHGRASLRSRSGRASHVQVALLSVHVLVVPRSKLVSSELAFFVAAPRAWNSLPVDIRLITDTKLFKKKLKTYLFNLAYPTISQ